MVPFISELDPAPTTAAPTAPTAITPTTSATSISTAAETTTTGTTDTTSTADSLFAKALTTLSFQDRNTIEDEIHGVSSLAIPETPQLLARSLLDFEAAVHHSHPKSAYDKAQELLLSSSSSTSRRRSGSRSSYLHQNNFRLRFLRCELFDVRKAVARYLHYVEFLLEVYGEYALLRPIRMSDLTHEELTFFKEGQHQILPYCDRSGRRIIGIVPQQTKTNISKQLLLKVHFYLFNACAGGYCETTTNTDTDTTDRNNIECHQKGVVVVYFPSWQHDMDSATSSLQRTKNQVQNRVAQTVPLRIVGLHACFPNTQVYRVYGKLVAMLHSAHTTLNLNQRTKIHVGSPVEWRYALQSYGIPTEIIPATHTGNVKLDKWKQWIKCKTYTEQLLDRQQQEQRTHHNNNNNNNNNTNNSHSHLRQTTIVECPGSTDVLFRRGRSIDFHPGNAMFQNILEAHMAHHAHPSTTPSQQRAIERAVIRQVQQQGQAMGHGGRFLKWEIHQGWWSTMSSSTVNVNVNGNVNGHENVDNNNNNNRSTTVAAATDMTIVSLDSSTNGETSSASSMHSVSTPSHVVKSKKRTTIQQTATTRNNTNATVDVELEEEQVNPEIQSKVHYAFRDFQKKITRRAQQQQQQQQQQPQQHNSNNSGVEQPITTHHSSHLTSAFMNNERRHDGQQPQQQKRKRRLSSSNNDNTENENTTPTTTIGTKYNTRSANDAADESGSIQTLSDRTMTQTLSERTTTTTTSDTTRIFCLPFFSDNDNDTTNNNQGHPCGYFPLSN